jgi:hypothetical protein
MAVRKLKAKKQVNYALPMMQRQLIAPLVTTMLPADNFKGALGDTVVLKVTDGSIATAREYDFRGRTGPIVLDDIFQTGGNFSVKLNKHFYSATGLEDEHFTLDDITFATDVLAPQVEAVAEKMENATVAAFRNLSFKHELDFDASDDPHLVTLEARRLMDSEKVAPRSGRVFLIGSDVAAAWLASDRLSKYDSTGETGTPALREATIGRLAGAPVIEHNGLDPDEAYYLHSTGLLVANVAPAVPRGAVTGNSGISSKGYALRWVQDYDANYLRDRSIVSTFYGVNEVRDERDADGNWIIETGEFDSDELAVMKNRDGSDVVPVAAGTRKNVRAIKLTATGTGAVFTPTP